MKEKFKLNECILGAILGAVIFTILISYFGVGSAFVVIFGSIIGMVIGLLAKIMKLKENKHPLCIPLFGIILSVIFVLLPVLTHYFARMIAAINGCYILNSGPSSCLMFGIDLGHDLYMMKQSIWLGMLTFPMGGVAITIFLLWFVIQSIITLKRKKQIKALREQFK